MAHLGIFTKTRHLRMAGVSVLLLIIGVVALTLDKLALAQAPTAAQTNVITSVPAPSPARQEVKLPATLPLWTELSAPQQQALAPLASEWNHIDLYRKKKWLEIANKFPSAKPDEQLRMQERMREWAKLTPDQRRVARDSYSRTKKLNPDQKSAQWEAYQRLSDEQKSKLTNYAESKKPVANLPSAQSRSKTIPPIKSTPKPVLERSVTPEGASQSMIQPSPRPQTTLPPVTPP